ncbi:MAG TPA: sigma-54 dependent transcriptional regulator [Terriglobales bacterium]|nr:sigma-54 dependent transcriptional regulator [Terriglobales bacterium]
MKVVVIDDDQQILDLITDALGEEEHLQMIATTDPARGLEIVLQQHPQIVLLDLMMPQIGGMELLERIVEAEPGTDVILLTGDYSTESAVEAIQKGASDYLTKPVNLERLTQCVRKSIATAHKGQRALELDRELAETFRCEGMVGRSPLMLDVFAKINRVAPHFKTVLIFGETGTGKEVAARAIHAISPVATAPFVVCNCAAIVETLIESELFGYVKGAFTGAVQDKVGLFEYANGGTVFLDEIGELPLSMQAKLLRVLQNQEVQRVGSPATRKVNVRVVAATNRDLRDMVLKKEFREDLYYRLTMVEIKLPRLADRKEDLALLQRALVERFATQYGKTIRGITRRAQAMLNRYSWPGNVRELENVLGNACMMADGDMVDITDLPEYLRSPERENMSGSDDLLSMEQIHQRHARHIMERVGGNKVRAAEILGISRATLYRLLEAAEPSVQERS